MELSRKEAKEFLEKIGFVKGSGFDGIVYTNVNNPLLIQVWVYFSGKVPTGDTDYNAKQGLGVEDFITWWEKQTLNEIQNKRPYYYE